MPKRRQVRGHGHRGKAQPSGQEFRRCVDLADRVLRTNDWLWANACYLVREPSAGDPHARFDERDVETELWRSYSGTARRKRRKQTNWTYGHRVTSRLYPDPTQRAGIWPAISFWAKYRPAVPVRLAQTLGLTGAAS